MRSCSKFFPNTFMAPSSASSVRLFLISRSMAGAISLSYASSTTSVSTAAVGAPSFVITCFLRYFMISSVGASIFTVRIFSFSPRLIASVL